jgi:hypothetical protein
MRNRLFAVIAALSLGVLACGSQQSTAATAAAQTEAYDSNLATGLALALEQTAAAFPTFTPYPTLELLPAETPGPTDTPEPSVTPLPNFPKGTIPLLYGDSIDGFPGQDTVIYGFQGSQDDNVGVSLSISNAHPELAICKRGMRLNFYLRNDQFETLDLGSVPQNHSTTAYLQLPRGGDYYIYVTCAGSGCATFCAEVKVTLDKK